MIQSPKIHRVMLFKHGVASLERSGPASGDFELSFKRDEMNDVLKSLSVWVAQGEGKVGAIDFEAPEDPMAALAERHLSLQQGRVGSDFVHALRGRRVELDVDGEPVRGEVIGLEETPSGSGAIRRQLVIRSMSDAVRMVDWGQINRVRLMEDRSRTDLGFLVDRTRAATSGSSRTVKVAVSGAVEDLRVSYVVPAPIWRVSYRLAVEGDQLVLMAWGIVFNPVDEDLEEVELILTTGQPVSFVIDLYEPKHVKRAHLEEKTRVAAPPPEIERPMRAKRRRSAPPPAPGAMASGAPAPASVGSARRSMAESMPEAVAGGDDRGEFFEYRVGLPISIKRGGSAMVPLLNRAVKGRKQRIWQAGRGPNPDLMVRFENTTDAVLEEGAVVVYEEGRYAGEAMLPYSGRTAEVQMVYAKDLAVRCDHQHQSASDVISVRFAHETLLEEVRYRHQHTYRAQNGSDQPVEVVFVMPKTAGRTLMEGGPKPSEETPHTYRFTVTVAPQGAEECVVSELDTQYRRVSFEHLNSGQLESWREGKLLQEGFDSALTGLLELTGQLKQLVKERQHQQALREAAYAKMSKIAEQLKVLRDQGDEARLRARYVRDLEQAQDQINEYETQIGVLDAQEKALAKKVEEVFGSLGG